MPAARPSRYDGPVHLTAPDAALVADFGAAGAYARFQATLPLFAYPQLASTGREAPATFTAHQERHTRRTALVVTRLFATLVGATAWTVATHPTSALAWTSAVTTMAVLATSALWAVPLHEALERELDAAAMRRLPGADAVRDVAARTQGRLEVAQLRGDVAPVVPCRHDRSDQRCGHDG